jgi:hypothetical protein
MVTYNVILQNSSEEIEEHKYEISQKVSRLELMENGAVLMLGTRGPWYSIYYRNDVAAYILKISASLP